jgi:hypothetical protein
MSPPVIEIDAYSKHGHMILLLFPGIPGLLGSAKLQFGCPGEECD